ncbi:MAG: magnesium chelatase domain-containing protein [Candidatus Sulfotelmatobacter sp.]
MLYKTLSAAVYGIDANIIQVEVDCSGIKTDQDHFHTVGLPDAAVRESRDRVRAALKNCGYDIPPTHITINLAPADIKKEGSGFDLPMALGIVGAYGGLTQKAIEDCLFIGELSLDGGVRGIRGTLPRYDPTTQPRHAIDPRLVTCYKCPFCTWDGGSRVLISPAGPRRKLRRGQAPTLR